MSLQENQDKALKMFENILNKETLQTNILVVALFVLFFEQLKDFIIDRPLVFYCFDSCEIKDGKVVYKENDTYKQKVRNFDPKKIFHASVQWFQERNALSQEEALTIFKAEQRRNDFVHEFLRTLTEGWQEEDSILLGKIISLYQRLDSWWVYNIELDDEVPNPEEVTQEECYSLSAAILNVIKDIALGNDEPYSGWMEQIRGAVRQQRAKAPATATSQSRDEKQEVKNEKIQ